MNEERGRRMLDATGLRDRAGLPSIVRDTFQQEAGIGTAQRSRRSWTTKPFLGLCDCPADSYRCLSMAGEGGYTAEVFQLTQADATEHDD